MYRTTDLQAEVSAEFTWLADVLAGLGDGAWDTQSLCAGWRVREVVAHMTMAVRYTPPEFYAELEACRGDFTLLSNRLAARERSPADQHPRRQPPRRRDARGDPTRRWTDRSTGPCRHPWLGRHRSARCRSAFPRRDRPRRSRSPHPRRGPRQLRFRARPALPSGHRHDLDVRLRHAEARHRSGPRTSDQRPNVPPGAVEVGA